MRPSFEKELILALNRESRFMDSDFAISEVDSPFSESYKIIYRWEPLHFFEFDLPENPGSAFSVKVSPGVYLRQESFPCEGQKAFFQALGSWLFRLREDLESHPFVREVATMKDAIKAIGSRVEGMPDEILTPDAVEGLRARLDKMQASMEAQLSDHDAEIQELRKTIRVLKSRLEPGTKAKKWYEQAAAALLRLARVPGFKRLAAGAIKETLSLPDGVEEIVEALADDQGFEDLPQVEPTIREVAATQQTGED